LEKLGSILVIVDRTAGSNALRKALILARHFGSRIELFMCDAEHAYALRQLYDRRGAEEARSGCLLDCRRYLEALRSTISGMDVRIDIDVACESPAYEGIVRKVQTSAPDLVMRERGAALGATDWHLIRTCPAPLMLVHGRAWHPAPRFAAAVDVSEQESPGLARRIAHAAEYLKLGCGASLDLIYSAPPSTPDLAQQERALGLLAAQFGVPAPSVHLLHGEPAQTLPRFVAERDYDVLFVGALAHRRALAALVGTLTERLLEHLQCDCVVVKLESYSSPFREAAPKLAPQASH
jgi:universal stress protein E